MKKNGIFSAKSVLTLVSVLSVLLIFSLFCVGALYVLNKMDVVYFPFEESETEEKGINSAVSLPFHQEETNTVSIVSPDLSAYTLLTKETPFTDSFYLKLRVNRNDEDTPTVSIFEIWRFGEKYRINRYNDQDEVEYMITCDGERVQVVEFATLTDSYYMMNEGFHFDDITPLPDFSTFFTEEYEIFEYSASDELYVCVCEYPEERRVDDIRFYKSTGLLSVYKRIQNGKNILSIETLAANASYPFSAKMFEIIY